MDARLWDGGTPMAGCIDVFCHAAQWVVGLARELDHGVAGADVPGLILYGGEVAALQVPLPEILDCLAGRPAGDPWLEREARFWRQAIRQYLVVDASVRGHHLLPGEPPPAGLLYHVEFQPAPRWLPFADITLGLDRLAGLAHLPPRDLHFHFHGLPMMDGTTLFNAVRAKPREQDEIQEALDHWRERLAGRLPASLAAPPSDDDEFIPPLPDELRGCVLPRSRLARLLHRSDRQLRRWDHCGQVPTGRRWTKGERVSGGVVLYDIERNWPALASMLGRGRDAARDHALAAELARDARQWRNAQD